MKGQVLINCGAMGLDPAVLSLSGYIEALAAHNAAHDPKKSAAPPEVSEDLHRFVKAHTLQ